MRRAGAAVLDFLISIFAAFAVVGWTGADMKIVVPGVLIAVVLYRRFLSASPGQQIMGVRTTERGLATFAIALVVVIYVGLTVGGGAFVRRLTDQKLNASAIGIHLVSWTPPSTSDNGLRQWIDGAVLSVPDEVDGWRAELAHCCIFYGPYDSESFQPGLTITVLKTNHPYEFCRGAVNPWARALAGCGDGPLQFQRAFVAADKSHRDRALSPLAVVRRNFALIAKSQSFEDADPASPVRVFRRGDTDIVWMTGTLALHKNGTELKAPMDRFFLANADNAVGVDLIWKRIPRDAKIAERIASSLALAPGTQGSSGGGEIPRLYNAVRIANYALEPLTGLVGAIERSGTRREREYLALHLEPIAAKDPTIVPLMMRLRAQRSR